MICSLLLSCSEPPLAYTHASPAPDSIVLRVHLPAPHSSNPIMVEVTNRQSQPIVVMDHQTNCTFLLVEQQTDGQWHPLRNCHVMTPTSRSTLAAGQTRTIFLHSTTWPMGFYHVKLEYLLGQQASPTRTAYSASFVL